MVGRLSEAFEVAISHSKREKLLSAIRILAMEYLMSVAILFGINSKTNQRAINQSDKYPYLSYDGPYFHEQQRPVDQPLMQRIMVINVHHLGGYFDNRDTVANLT